MLSNTLLIALDCTLPAYLTVHSRVSSQDALKYTPRHVLKHTPNCTRWYTAWLLGSPLPNTRWSSLDSMVSWTLLHAQSGDLLSCRRQPAGGVRVVAYVRQCLVCGQWGVCSVLCMACGLWHVAHSMWHVTCGMWRVACGMWCVVCGMWHVACGMWHVVCGVRRVSCGGWQLVGGACWPKWCHWLMSQSDPYLQRIHHDKMSWFLTVTVLTIAVLDCARMIDNWILGRAGRLLSFLHGICSQFLVEFRHVCVHSVQCWWT